MFSESFFNYEGTCPQNVNKTQTFPQQYLSEFERRSKDPSLPRVSIGPDGQYVYYASEDWYGLLYKKSTPSTEHNLSLSRSADNPDYRLLAARVLVRIGQFSKSDQHARWLIEHAPQPWQREWAQVVHAQAIWRMNNDSAGAARLLEEIIQDATSDNARQAARDLLQQIRSSSR